MTSTVINGTEYLVEETEEPRAWLLKSNQKQVYVSKLIQDKLHVEWKDDLFFRERNNLATSLSVFFSVTYAEGIELVTWLKSIQK